MLFKLNLKASFLTFNILLLLLIVFSRHSHAETKNNIIEIIQISESKLDTDIGVSIYDSQTKDFWNYNGDMLFPLMSTFKTLACAKLLADSEANRLDINSSKVILESALIPWSPVTKKMIGKSISLQEACKATMTFSDNSAANIILSAIGGPAELTKYMRSIGDDVTRLDRIEPELGEAKQRDKRDTTSANAMVQSLNSLFFGEHLSQTSKTQLKKWMIGNKVSDDLFRAVLPESWMVADRSGAGGYGSRGITAIVWPDKQSPIIIAIYLTQTEATLEQRNAVIANIGKAIFDEYQ